MPKISRDLRLCIFLFCIGVIVYTRALSMHGLEYRDDEIFYYKSTIEMVNDSNYFSPTYFGENRWQKPILYYWFILLCYKIFGVGWFAARFTSVIFASLSACFTYLLGKELFNRRVGWMSSLIVMTIPLFFRHAKNAVPDMTLNFFIVLAFWAAVRFIKSKKSRYSVLFFSACALGFMIKGLAALVFPIAGLVIYALWDKKAVYLKDIRFMRGIFVMILIIAPWFIYMSIVHGQQYVDYMLIEETKNRLLVEHQGNPILLKLKEFVDHILFYIQVIFSYFAPWSLFLIGAIPLAIIRQRKALNESPGLKMVLVWFFSVFTVFSLMYFTINHYMLVLSSAFALLTAYFLNDRLEALPRLSKVKLRFQKSFFLVISTIAFSGYLVLFILLGGASNLWLLLLLPIYAGFMAIVIRSQKPLASPYLLSALMLFVLFQSSLMGDVGITSHSTLQKFAETINTDKSKDYVIGVGSHDIHEKEFQVYFTKKIAKVANSEDHQTKKMIHELITSNSSVYCLLTGKDFDAHLKDWDGPSLTIIQEELMIRKRFYIDGNFFLALLKLDRQTVRYYLMENIMLVKKGA